LVFSLNDFDETMPGPFEWDVKRLIASFAVAGRERGFSKRQRRKVSLAAARSYRTAMRAFSKMRTLDVWYARLEVDEIVRQWGREVRAKRLDRIERDLARRRAKDHLRAFAKLTEVVDGERRIVSDPPLIVPIEELVPFNDQERLGAAIEEIFESYRGTLAVDRRQLLEHFRFAHVARKVVGVGVSAFRPGSCCCSAATMRTRSSFRSRRRRLPCSSLSSESWNWRITVAASFKDSG
jgi:Uncharacterized protein conserved in bacteria (DUF2252)